MENNNRGTWGSNFGFLMATIGSAVGLGNIWGFPYKMGRGGGFKFLLIYIALSVAVGVVMIATELAIGRKTGKGVVGAYNDISKRFKWVGWLGLISPFIIVCFYSVLGAYCVQYLCLNLAELSFDLHFPDSAALFENLLTTPLGGCIFTFLFIFLTYIVVIKGISGGIEKFNKIGMPALFVMLIIIIIRSLTLDSAIEGIKYMFVPGYAVEAGYIAEESSFISVLSSAGSQMFLSLSLAMGILITYGSYMSKKQNLVKNSFAIICADTIVAVSSGIAVIPAAVATGIRAINSGATVIEDGIERAMTVADIKLGGPNLLFVTLQDVFASMGKIGPLFGVVFYTLVIIAALSSTISLVEVLTTHFMDKHQGDNREAKRKKVTTFSCLAIIVLATVVAADGLGANNVWLPFKHLYSDGNIPLLSSWLDFLDCWTEGIAMPLGAVLMALMVGYELKPRVIIDELEETEPMSKTLKLLYSISIRFIVPVVMTFVLLGQISSFFGLGWF